MMFKTMADVRDANRANGNFFFSRDTMRFFASKIESGLYGGRYFITSEKNFDGSQRFYTIREAKPDGDISTVGEFRAYRNIEGARSRCRELVREAKEA
jgi:hypothetical protein